MAKKATKTASPDTSSEPKETAADNAPRRVYRSRREKVFGGVCGGVAEYFNLDPVLVRIFWVVATFAEGLGLIAYIIAWIIIPENPDEEAAGTETPPEEQQDKNSGVGMIVGIGLVIIGLLLLADQFHFPYNFWLFRFFDLGVLFAIAMVALGAYFIYDEKSSAGSAAPSETGEKKALVRSVTDRKIAGVCAGLGHYFGIDPTIVRVLFVILAFNPYLLSVIAYGVMMFVVPEERVE